MKVRQITYDEIVQGLGMVQRQRNELREVLADLVEAVEKSTRQNHGLDAAPFSPHEKSALHEAKNLLESMHDEVKSRPPQDATQAQRTASSRRATFPAV